MIVLNLTPQNNSIRGRIRPGDVVLINCDATDEAFTVTLPDAKSLRDNIFKLVKNDSSANAVTIDTTANQTINSDTSISLDSQWDSAIIVTDRSNYIRIATGSGGSTGVSKHDIDDTAAHNGVSGATEDNLMAFDSNGLPKDSGITASDGFTFIQDEDGDTYVRTEESLDEDYIRFGTAGTERAIIDDSGVTRIYGDTAIGSDFAPQVPFHVSDDIQTNVHYHVVTTAAIESEEANLQIISENELTEGSNIILTNAPASSGDNKHWFIRHRGPSSSNRFDIGYTTTTATGQDVILHKAPHFSIETGGHAIFYKSLTVNDFLIVNDYLTVNDDLTINGLASVLAGNEFRFYDVGNSNYVGFEAPALTANQIWVLPATDGSANQALITDGGGNLSFGAATPAAHTHDGDTLQFDGVNSDGGAFSFTTTGTVTFNQSIAVAGINDSSLTASRLVATDGSKNLVSSDLNSWVAGTSNQITVSDDGDGTITLSTPQDINTSSSPTFVNMGLTGYINMPEIATPSNPSANEGRIYVKDDGAGTTTPYFLDSAGTETSMISGGLTIGDPITGGGANRVLFEDGSNQLAQDSDFTYTSDELNVGTSYAIGGTTILRYEASNNLLVGSGISTTISGIGGNTVVGDNAGASLTDGQQNCLYGLDCGTALTTQDRSVMMGYRAGENATSTESTFIGYSCGQNSTGDGNVIVGAYAGSGLSSGSYNLLYGYGSGDSINTGSHNCIIGGQQGADTLTTGSFNIGIGSFVFANALTTGNYNIAIGHEALRAYSQNAAPSTVVGGQAARYLTSGYASYFGTQCGYRNTTGSHNSGFGRNCLYNNVTGDDNCAFGQQSANGTSGNSHSNGCFFGYQAGFGITTADNVVLVGFNAGYGIGAYDGCVIIGKSVGYTAGNIGASNRLMIHNSDVSNPLIWGEFDNRLIDFNVDTFEISAASADTDITVNFSATTNSGQFKWMEDEDYFQLNDDMLFPVDERIYFGDTDVSVYSNDDGYLDFEADTNVRTNAFIRHTSASYRRYYHLALSSFDPGESGATWTDPTSNYLSGWRLDAAAETLHLNTDVHSDWDAASDLDLEVTFTVMVDNTGGGAGDTVDLKFVCYYKGEGETSCKTQTVEEAVTVGACAQYTQFKHEFTIDYDAASNVVEAGDVMSIIANLETDTSEVDDVVINDVSFYYHTTHVGIESGDT